MPHVIDEEKLNDPSTTTLDIAHPPLKQVPHAEYPKMVYLHPKDKAKEHKHRIVESREEEEAAAKKGYRTKPHIPVVPDEDELDAGEFETSSEPAAPRAESKPAAPKGKGK